jgi:hypothetical protein
MTDALTHAVAALERVDLFGWDGLPADVLVRNLSEAFDVGADDIGTGLAGDPPGLRRWLALPSTRYTGGLVAWCDDDHVVLLEGRDPVDEQGELLTTPDIGEPEATFATPLGRLWLDDGERVVASRGLAVRVNPANGLLLGVLGFVPTTVDDYARRVRPHLEPRTLRAATRGGAR